MLGLLKGVIDRVQPLVPELKIEWSDNSFLVIYKRPRYSMGLIPKHIDDVEEQLAAISIENDEENDRFVLLVEHTCVHTIDLTVPGSGHVENEGYVYQYRFDEAAEELAKYLKDLAGV